jgi:threonine dehydrogenase-like Zn-dependent dehydrogenase
MSVDLASTTDLPERARAPQFAGNKGIGVWERVVPRPGPGQLLLAVRANAVCGTDRHQWIEGSEIVPGHEAAGVVVAAGTATTIPIGTPGVVFLMDYCGICRSCRVGATNQCFAKRADMGLTHDGGYGQFELVHESNFFPVPMDLPLADATLLLDVMGTTGHAIRRARLVVEEIESIAVSGAGPLGLGFVVMARLLLGPDVPVVVSDVQQTRLAMVERLGGRPVNVQKRSLESGLRRQGLKSVDVTIDTAGRSESRRALLDATAKRGALVCVGHGEGLDLTISADLIAPERAVLGSEYFRYDELPGNLALLLAHRDELAPIITHRFPVDMLAEAFDLFMAGETGKVVIVQ